MMPAFSSASISMRQDVQHRRIFVAHVEIDALGLDRPGGNQRALEHLLRIALEIIAVLERAGFALVAVDGHQPGPLIGAHDLPFAPGGEACAAEPAQAGVGHVLDDGVERQLACPALLQHRIAALGAILGQCLVAGNICLALAAVDRRLDGLWRGVIDEIMSDLGDRRGIAASHARRAQHPHLGRIGAGLERLVQCLGAFDGAGDGIAHPNGRGRGRGLALLHHVEMGVEGRDLVSGRLRQTHLLAQRPQMGRGDIMIAVLNQVQIFDQQIGATRLAAQQFLYVLERVVFELASFGKASGPLARADMSCRPVRSAAAIWGLLLHAYSHSLRPRPASNCPAMRE